MAAHRFQIVIVGSGFAGSLMAMVSHRLGLKTLLLERGRHPRFAIGESSTPLANLLLEELAVQYQLPGVLPLCKWGSWQSRLPEIGCGLKRGFTFFQHEPGRPFTDDPALTRQLLVGASPHESVSDTHWYRPDFDHYLVRQAQEMGVTYWDEVEMSRVSLEQDHVKLLGHRHEETLEVTADFVIDATGPRGFLYQQLGLRDIGFHGFPGTQALYTHFEKVGSLPAGFSPTDRPLPYPPEQAAVHHVFPGGWVWVLKFNNGLTSAGVVAVDELATQWDLRSGAKGWARFLKSLPSVAEIFKSARATRPFVYLPRVASLSETITGRRWAQLPSAAGVVDPLLSTGFPLALLGIVRLGNMLRKHGGNPPAGTLAQYAGRTRRELATTARMVGALYATMDRFEVFQDLSLLYFAAASFSETVRRLGKPQKADGFLLYRNPAFAARFQECCAAAERARTPGEIASLRQQIHSAIEPFDVAGLTDRTRHPWYPALTGDLYRNAHKVGATETEITAMLKKCGI